MNRKYMDSRYNGFNRFNQNNFGRGGCARECPYGEDFRARKFDKYNQFNRDQFRDNFRGNIAGFRDNLQRDKAEKSFHEKEECCDALGEDGYSEKFHERQVDYHKNVHTKQSNDDLRGERDDLRRGRDDARCKGRGFQQDFRG